MRVCIAMAARGRTSFPACFTTVAVMRVLHQAPTRRLEVAYILFYDCDRCAYVIAFDRMFL